MLGAPLYGTLALLANIKIGCKGLLIDKHFSLFWPFISCEEKKSFVKMVTGVEFHN
jgi:hypothetical protein